jgi:hypothetical protein
MPRVLGIDIPNDRKTVVSLTYLYGVGDQTARELCHKAAVDPDKRARDLTDQEISAHRAHPGAGLHCRRSAASPGAAEHQPPSRHSLLPRNPAPNGSAGTWTANQNECSHPKRTEERPSPGRRVSKISSNGVRLDRIDCRWTLGWQ